jgi:hypothetical protein
VHLTICFPESGQMVRANHTPTLDFPESLRADAVLWYRRAGGTARDAVFDALPPSHLEFGVAHRHPVPVRSILAEGRLRELLIMEYIKVDSDKLRQWR